MLSLSAHHITSGIVLDNEVLQDVQHLEAVGGREIGPGQVHHRVGHQLRGVLSGAVDARLNLTDAWQHQGSQWICDHLAVNGSVIIGMWHVAALVQCPKSRACLQTHCTCGCALIRPSLMQGSTKGACMQLAAA
eukprot:scaffold105715_cov21-Tisochrysis_lutea.AAC.1